MTRRHQAADSIHLEGPSDPTVTPPPPRQTGLLVVSGILGLLVVGLVGVAIVQPELLVGAVQAFVGR